MHGDGGWWMLFGGIWIFAILGLLVWLVTRMAHGQGMRGGDSLEIVRRRYATGEITREQFDQMRQDLGAPYAGETPTAIGLRGHGKSWLLPLFAVVFLAATTLLVLAATVTHHPAAHHPVHEIPAVLVASKRSGCAKDNKRGQDQQHNGDER